MFGINRWQKITRALISSLLTGVLVLSVSGCSRENSTLRAATPTGGSSSTTQLAGNISEVSPPEVIQQLRQTLEVYQPQVKILSPQSDEVLQDNTVQVQFQVEDLPLFKNPEFDMGPHLHAIIDNQPYRAVYDINQPLVLSDLSPGTHTLRVFASRPWHESFKNEGAYAQTTFHVFTKTDDNNPNLALPLLTYSRPKGSYGAEPILLDFYLTNAPLHLVAQESPEDEIADWRIRCTINGSSFVMDRWQPVYLKGFKPGKNWVQLEFLDEQGNTVKNVFNNTVRVINYEPNGQDTLSKLVRGELSVDAARAIVEQNYTAKVQEITPTPLSSPEPTPAVETTPEAQAGEDKEVEIPESVPVVTPEVETPLEEPTSLVEPEAEELKQPEKQKSGGFFNRLRRSPSATPSPSLEPTLPEIIEPSESELVPPAAVPQSESVPAPEPLTTSENSVNQENDADIESEASKPKLDIKEILLP